MDYRDHSSVFASAHDDIDFEGLSRWVVEAARTGPGRFVIKHQGIRSGYLLAQKRDGTFEDVRGPSSIFVAVHESASSEWRIIPCGKGDNGKEKYHIRLAGAISEGVGGFLSAHEDDHDSDYRDDKSTWLSVREKGQKRPTEFSFARVFGG